MSLPHLGDVAIDEARLIVGRDRLLDLLRGERHGEVGGVLGELALGEPDLQVDFAARLLDQAMTLVLGGLA